MNKLIKTASVVLIFAIVVIALSVCSGCSNNAPAGTNAEHYIKINGESIDKEYIGYFFYLAQRNMLEEAGWKSGNNGNATEEDIRVYWETTEIDGKNAVDAARDLAADNAVRQKIQYFKAVEEGITLSDSEIKEINLQIDATISNNGGKNNFETQLSDMDTDMKAYTQIITENLFIQKLYNKYEVENKLMVSDSDLSEFILNNSDKYPQEMMLDAAKKQKFNDLVTQWEKEYEIEINDFKMNNFSI